MAGRKPHPCKAFRSEYRRRLCRIQNPRNYLRRRYQAFRRGRFFTVYDWKTFSQQRRRRSGRGRRGGWSGRWNEAYQPAEHFRFHDLRRQNAARQYQTLGKKKLGGSPFQRGFPRGAPSCPACPFHYDERTVEEQLFWSHWPCGSKTHSGWRTLRYGEGKAAYYGNHYPD